MKLKYYIPTSSKHLRLLELWVISLTLAIIVMSMPTNAYTWSNDLTNDNSLYLTPNSGQSITFSSDPGFAPFYIWTVDGVFQTGVNTQTFATSFSDGGLHYVESTTILDTSYHPIWRVSVKRAMASAPVATINQTPYANIKQDVRNYDFNAVMSDSITPYTNIFGSTFWLFIWLMIFCAYWIRQRQVTFPTVIALIFGGVIIGTLPEEYQIYAKGLVAVGVFAVIYIFFSERR